MLEEAIRGETISKEAYGEAVDRLRVDLLNAQYDLRSAPFPVIVVVAGDDRIGANDALNVLHEWMDSRYLDTTVFRDLTAEEAERPRFWRTWMALPAHGRTGIWVGGILRVVNQRLDGTIDDDALDAFARELERMEDMLVADGAMVVKLWFHLPPRGHAKRLKQARKRRGPGWRVDDLDWLVYERLADATPLIERFLRQTESASGPWHVVDGTSRRHRNLVTGRLVLEGIRRGLARPPAPPTPPPAPIAPPARTVLDRLDLDERADEASYRTHLALLQTSLRRLSLQARDVGLSTVLVFEGNDAAGKGGAIRRITTALEAGDYKVHPIAAPTQEEHQHHYLWRFWRRLPRDGEMAIFDRSWYGRVLVERIEGFATEDEWRRAYDEINDFEAQLVEGGDILCKFWLAISAEEQMARFNARQATPYKQHKITEEDWRNREKWDDYVAAVDEMVLRTSTDLAPWTLVAANDKRHARLVVLETVVEALEQRLRPKKRRRHP